ncbi:MAG: MarR family winged helix-turn-helix transcriptional regulator [Rhodospirillales bacterium]|jgi:DNA-binding MarR family transcriptional regulator
MTNENDIILNYWKDDLPDDRIAHLIKDATRALVRSLQNKLKEHGVPFGHWSILRILWVQDGLSQRELSSMAGIMESTTANVVRQMEAKGQISRRHLGKNMRKQHVFLTEQGKKMEHVLVPLAMRVNSTANNNINEREIKALRKTLLKMIENLGSEELNSK